MLSGFLHGLKERGSVHIRVPDLAAVMVAVIGGLWKWWRLPSKGLHPWLFRIHAAGTPCSMIACCLRLLVINVLGLLVGSGFEQTALLLSPLAIVLSPEHTGCVMKDHRVG